MKTNRKKAGILVLCFTSLALLIGSFAVVPWTEGFGAVPTKQVKAANAPQSQVGATFAGGYMTVEGMQAFLDSQVGAHPTLAEKVDFGDSWCKIHESCTKPGPAFGGYGLLALHITNRNIPGPKPVFWFDAGMHADEMVPPEIAVRFITWLLDGYNSNPDAHWLVDYDDIWVVPMLNPDGHHITELGGDRPYLQRKNADSANGCSAFDPNGLTTFGTDLNRNFPFKWGPGDPALNDPCSQLYRGPSAGSEPETQAVMTLLKQLIPDQRGPGDADAAPLNATGIVQSMHSVARINFYPWNYSTDPSPNTTDLNNIVAHMSAPDAGGNGYKYCQSGALGCLGGADGNSMDWVYGELGAAAITTEIEGDSFSPPYSQVETVWNHNRQNLIYMAKLARTPYLTTRGPDVKDLAAEPAIVNIGSQPHLTAAINFDWQGNSYFQNVGGAEYYIDSPPWAGGTPVALSAVDGTFNSPTELVQASINTSRLSVGQHIIFVRGKGTQSYGGAESWGPVTAFIFEVVQAGGTPVPSATALPANAPTPIATPASSHTPLPPAVALPGSNSQFFPETGKTVTGLFLDYWNQHGGLAQQGYPISDMIGELSDLDGKQYTVQYFERAVFEYHPENAGTPFEVLLSQLGTFRYRERYPEGAPGQIANVSSGSVAFQQTGKHLGGIFLDYWNNHGGLAQQGYPISDEFTEVSDLDGKPYTVQYFERAVFEHHPENGGTVYEVLLSQLGTFRYHAIYLQIPRKHGSRTPAGALQVGNAIILSVYRAVNKGGQQLQLEGRQLQKFAAPLLNFIPHFGVYRDANETIRFGMTLAIAVIPGNIILNNNIGSIEMKPNHEISDSTTITFRQLCEALEDEALPAAIEDGFYLVRRGDLKRFMLGTPGERNPMLLESLPCEPVQVAS